MFLHLNVEVFYFGPSPLCFTQKLQAGFDTWVIGKAANVNSTTELFPAIVVNKFCEQFFQGNTV